MNTPQKCIVWNTSAFPFKLIYMTRQTEKHKNLVQDIKNLVITIFWVLDLRGPWLKRPLFLIRFIKNEFVTKCTAWITPAIKLLDWFTPASFKYQFTRLFTPAKENIIADLETFLTRTIYWEITTLVSGVLVSQCWITVVIIRTPFWFKCKRSELYSSVCENWFWTFTKVKFWGLLTRKEYFWRFSFHFLNSKAASPKVKLFVRGSNFMSHILSKQL